MILRDDSRGCWCQISVSLNQLWTLRYRRRGSFKDFKSGHLIRSALGSNLLSDSGHGQHLKGRLEDSRFTDTNSSSRSTGS